MKSLLPASSAAAEPKPTTRVSIGEIKVITFEMIDVRIPGTGDVFSAVLAGALLQKKTLPEACQKAMDAVEALIRQNQYNSDLYRGLRIEQAITENRGIL